KSLERVGLLKMDFLGLRTLTVLDDATRLILESAGKSIDLPSLPLDDAETYALLQKAQTVGIFQLESGGMRDLLRKVLPDTFEDIIAINALFRPGPIQSGMIDDFAKRKHGKQRVTHMHPSLEPILRKTYGVIVYQDQVMLSYHSAYLKAHHPAAFLAASLTSEVGDTDRIVTLVEEARRLGIAVLPPDVNASMSGFTLEGEAIRFGLSAIKNVGHGSVEALVRARSSDGRFRTLGDLIRR